MLTEKTLPPPLPFHLARCTGSPAGSGDCQETCAWHQGWCVEGLAKAGGHPQAQSTALFRVLTPSLSSWARHACPRVFSSDRMEETGGGSCSKGGVCYFSNSFTEVKATNSMRHPLMVYTVNILPYLQSCITIITFILTTSSSSQNAIPNSY